MSGRIYFLNGFLHTSVAGAFKYGNEHSGSRQLREFFD